MVGLTIMVSGFWIDFVCIHFFISVQSVMDMLHLVKSGLCKLHCASMYVCIYFTLSNVLLVISNFLLC